MSEIKINDPNYNFDNDVNFDDEDDEWDGDDSNYSCGNGRCSDDGDENVRM